MAKTHLAVAGTAEMAETVKTTIVRAAESTETDPAVRHDGAAANGAQTGSVSKESTANRGIEGAERLRAVALALVATAAREVIGRHPLVVDRAASPQVAEAVSP